MNDLITVSKDPFCAETAPRHLAHPITPTPAHYVRSNFEVPRMPDDATIEVGGSVRTPLSLKVSEIRAMPSRSVTFTMECAGNDRMAMRPVPPGEPWRIGAVSTAKWTGVPLGAVLDRAGVLPQVVEIAVEGADAGQKVDSDGKIIFCRSLPVDSLAPDVLLAYEMNDEPLTPHHGGPLRLVVPGWYGMASVKWITRIRAIDAPYDGYFQSKRYVYEYEEGVVPVRRARVKSTVVEPSTDATVRAGTSVDAWGWAWSGEGGVREVRVQGDSSGEWKLAALDAPMDEYTWRRWRCTLRFDKAGEYTLRTRATDDAGNVQPDVARWNRLGYGNNAVREVVISVL
jgi:DMSO/TMAO reductase YedYZ molybdopterin-dependent catalytic subunit